MTNYLSWLTNETQTKWWHDSAIPSQIDKGLSMGALGITTNPVLTYKTLQACPEFWKPSVDELDERMDPSLRAEALLRIVATYAAGRVHDIYLQTSGEHGYAFGQLSPALAGDKHAMLAQGLRVASWAENVAVKIPTTRAALYVIEELAARGIALCTSLNFSVAQALAAANAYQKGIARARAGNMRVKPCFVVQQGGRLEDYIRDINADLELGISEEVISKAGNALTKKTYRLFEEKGFEAKIMPAGLRGVHHLTELAGGKFVFTLHPRIQQMILEENPPLVERMDEPVDAKAIQTLYAIPEFIRAYEEDGLEPAEFMAFGVMQKTLSQFMETGWSMLETYGTKGSSQRWT
jgi:transaldolase